MTGDDRKIQISGNASVSGSQIASGENISQSQNIGGAPQPDPVTQAVSAVAELLDRHAAELPEPGRARRDLDDIRQEVAEADPDPDRLTHALRRLSDRVAGVAVLTGAVAELAAHLGLG